MTEDFSKISYWTPGTIAGDDARGVETLLKRTLLEANMTPDNVDKLAQHVLASHLLVKKNPVGRAIGLCTFQVGSDSQEAAIYVETLVDQRPDGIGFEELYGELLGMPETFPSGVFIPAPDDEEEMDSMGQRLVKLGFDQVHAHVPEDGSRPYLHSYRAVGQ